ncbi:MAG: helix-turn-helix transcriptional regulator [Cytophagales bacterium]|nr:helix-turn-helix transcriptional regulator [Armatimonadota bacterium]
MHAETNPQSAPAVAETIESKDDPHSGDDLFCPFNAALDLLTARWTLHVVRALLSGPCRFNEIAQAYGINAHTLRERLRALENEGVVVRTVISAMPPNVNYALTEKGLALNRVFEELASWGREWIAPPPTLSPSPEK